MLSERIVALAGTWPVAVTAELGVLHGIKGLHPDTLDGMAKTLWLSSDDIVAAVTFARAFGFALDPAFERVCPAV